MDRPSAKDRRGPIKSPLGDAAAVRGPGSFASIARRRSYSRISARRSGGESDQRRNLSRPPVGSDVCFYQVHDSKYLPADVAKFCYSTGGDQIGLRFDTGDGVALDI